MNKNKIKFFLFLGFSFALLAYYLPSDEELTLKIVLGAVITSFGIGFVVFYLVSYIDKIVLKNKK